MKIAKTIMVLLIIGMLLAGVYHVFKSPAGRVELPHQEQKGYLVQVKRDCKIRPQAEATTLLETTHFSFLVVKMTEKKAEELKRDKCVVRVLTPREVREQYESLPEEMKELQIFPIPRFRKMGLLYDQYFYEVATKKENPPDSWMR